jgi:hypothetical protein
MNVMLSGRRQSELEGLTLSSYIKKDVITRRSEFHVIRTYEALLNLLIKK